MTRKSAELVKTIGNFVKELAEETDSFKRSEAFKKYLEVMSRFWRYSYHNQFLILIQKPDATRVMGFRKWNRLKRHVIKGEKGIKILCPSYYKVKEEDPETGEETEVKKMGFIVGNVFDISQTNGEPLPEIEIRIKGDNYIDFFTKTELRDTSNSFVKEVLTNGSAGDSTITLSQQVLIFYEDGETGHAKDLVISITNQILAENYNLEYWIDENKVYDRIITSKDESSAVQSVKRITFARKSNIEIFGPNITEVIIW